VAAVLHFDDNADDCDDVLLLTRCLLNAFCLIVSRTGAGAGAGAGAGTGTGAGNIAGDIAGDDHGSAVENK